MRIRSENHPAAATTPGGFLRAVSRWVVEHTGLATLLLVLLVAALCFGQWRLAYRNAQDWDASHPGQPIPFHLLDTAGWLLIIGMGSWVGLWKLSNRDNEAAPSSDDADWWRFETRKRQRIFDSRPMRRRWLWIHGLFGLLGFVLALVLALRLAAAAAWQEPLLSRHDRFGPVLALVTVLVAAFGAGRVRDVLFVLNCNDSVGKQAEEIAQAVAEEEQAQSEAEREYERKTITGWPYVVFMGGLIGGLYLANRWLPAAEGNVASQASVSGLIGSVATLYLLKTKPRGWTFWLALALTVAVGFLVFTQVSWHRSPLYLLLGTLWGTGVGIAASFLYLRRLRGN